MLLFMSQYFRNEEHGNRDISRTATEGKDQKEFDGFEGMNYEQVRQPYNPQYTDRNSPQDERKKSRRPDEE